MQMKPHVFVTAHSGEQSMFVPYAFQDQACSHYDELLSIMKALNEKHLSGACQVGSAANVLNYQCPGTCLDFIYDQLKTKYAFGWEIFASTQNETEDRQRFLQFNKEESCFSFFNPLKKALYD